MRIEARKIDDGRGPYDWRKIVRQPLGLALGTIYDLQAADLADQELADAQVLLEKSGYEWREVAA